MTRDLVLVAGRENAPRQFAKHLNVALTALTSLARVSSYTPDNDRARPVRQHFFEASVMSELHLRYESVVHWWLWFQGYGEVHTS